MLARVECHTPRAYLNLPVHMAVHLDVSVCYKAVLSLGWFGCVLGVGGVWGFGGLGVVCLCKHL